VLALEAVLHASQDDDEEAFAALERSLSLARPSGFIRLFVDLGPNIAELLRRMQNREPYSQYIASILNAFPDTLLAESQHDQPWQLIEPLTNREAEIMDLLARRYSNKEIAAELFISPATVKRHTINIYQKLAVNKRREAVEAARSLGLIPHP
jgi:LuxR family maltose regulon positive regulatory protein